MNSCFFCNEKHFENYPFKVKLTKLLDIKDANRKIIHKYLEETILIPRCSNCRKIHLYTLKIQPFKIANWTRGLIGVHINLQFWAYIFGIPIIAYFHYFGKFYLNLGYNKFYAHLFPTIFLSMFFAFFRTLEDNELVIKFTRKKTKGTSINEISEYRLIRPLIYSGYQIGDIYNHMI